MIDREESIVRSSIAYAIGRSFMELQDRDQAWQDLHKLKYNDDCMVQESAVCGLILAFPDLPYKTQACQDRSEFYP